MTDIFDSISIYRSTDKLPLTNDAAKELSRVDEQPGDGHVWCVVRHTPADNPAGWPLKDLSTGSNQTVKDSPSTFGKYGFCDDADVALFLMEDAVALAKNSPHVAPGLLRDSVVHVRDIEWRVLFVSRYDHSRVEVYKGRDLNEANRALARCRTASHKKQYLHTVFEGVYVKP